MMCLYINICNICDDYVVMMCCGYLLDVGIVGLVSAYDPVLELRYWHGWKATLDSRCHEGNLFLQGPGRLRVSLHISIRHPRYTFLDEIRELKSKW